MSPVLDSIFWLCFQLKIVTRSFAMDITLVSLACFTLVCAISCWRETSASLAAGRHCYCVSIQQSGGTVDRYLVKQTFQTAEELRGDLVYRMAGRSAPERAVMQWYQESSQFYAAAVRVDPAAVATVDSDEVFRTAAVRQSVTPVEPGLNRWQAFWDRREKAASGWLAEQTTNRESRMELLSRSISISERVNWMPTGSVWKVAVGLSVLVLMAGLVWRFVCPVLSLQPDGGAGAQMILTPGGSQPAAMCFDASWVKARQPAGVLMRGMIGWGIVAAAVFAGVGVVALTQLF